MKKDKEALEEIQRQWQNFAQSSFVGEKFNLTTGTSISSRNISKERMVKYLENPVANYLQLQQASEYFMNNSGVYYRLMKALPMILTYDYSIYPFMESNKIEDNSEKILDSYCKASLFLEKLDVKKVGKMIATDIFENGEGYYYKIEDNTGIVFQKMPNKYCIPFMNENGVWR